MARIRSIKPEFFTSLTIADLPLSARLTFIGLWCYVDDNGVGLDEARLIRAAIWPLEETPDILQGTREDLQRLHEAGLIARYEDSGKALLAITAWNEHQKVSHPRKPRYRRPEDIRNFTPRLAEQAEPARPGNSGNPPEDIQNPPETLRPEQGSGSRDQGAGKEAASDPAKAAEEPIADADKPRRTTRDASKHETADQLTSAFWEHHKQRTAQSFIAIRGIVRTALANGLNRDDVARALDHLAREGRAISGGTLTTALGQLRQPVQGAFLTAIPGGADTTRPLPGTDTTVAGWLALSAQLADDPQEKHA